MKWLVFFVVFSVIPFAFADGLQFIEPPGTNVTLFANCQFDNDFVNSNANITVFFPDQSIFINNQPLSSYGTGNFFTNFITPQQLGVYEVHVWCDDLDNNKQGYATGNFQIKDIEEEVGLAMLGIAFLFAVLMAFILYLSKVEFAAGGLHRPIGFFLYALAIVISTGITYFLMMFSIGKPYEPFANMMFLTHLILAGITVAAIIVVTVIDTLTKAWTGKGVGEHLR